MDNLKNLFEGIKTGQIELTTDLPVFGGAEPRNTSGVWSWDETHLMVGYDSQSLRLLARTDDEAVDSYL